MKIIFKGWGKEIKTHTHKVEPVEFDGKLYKSLSANKPIFWNGSMSALGKVNKLSLTGAFLIELNFEKSELKSWLEEFAKENPEEALRIMAPIQAEALISLSKTSVTKEK